MKAEPRDTPTTSTSPERKPEATPTAVIDIGTNAIRMAVAEIDDAGNVRVLDNLAQAVDLGRDTFTRGIIRKSTVEECARILRSYRQFLQEYQITREDRIRVVATKRRPREAGNSLPSWTGFQPATGLQVDAPRRG
jgi:exopolyphosphatase/guanosine-5'-triphosphate,3'-diphosphate pyrophosphatase